MNAQMKKLIVSVLAVVLFVGGFFAYKQFFAGEKGSKAISITVVNEVDNKTVLEEKVFYTDAENLGDFMEEKKKELNAEIDQSQFGRFLVGLDGLTTKDMSAGPWWMYGYESEKKGMKMDVGQAPGMDELGLSDGDKVKFVFTANPGF